MKLNKKAISELVTYVLLISLAFAMSAAVYSWLKFYVQQPFAEESCPEVRLTIEDYSCTDGILNLTVQNRGRFDVDGYIIKINNGTRDYNIYEINNPTKVYVPFKMESGNITTGMFNFSSFGKIVNVEIEAVRGFKEGRPILCENSILRQKIERCITFGCEKASDCGIDGYVGETKCGSNPNKIYRDYVKFYCTNGKCSSSTTTYEIETCSGTTPYCINGKCACTQDSQCGTSGFIDTINRCGPDNTKIYRTYRKFSCISGICSSSDYLEIYASCPVGTSCVNGVCEETWIYQYNADALPQESIPAWINASSHTPNLCTQNASSGILYSISKSGGGICNIKLNNANIPSSYLLEMNTSLGGCRTPLDVYVNNSLLIKDGMHVYKFEIRCNQIRIGSNFYNINAQIPHVYKIVKSGTNVKIYVDDSLAITTDVLSTTTENSLEYYLKYQQIGYSANSTIDYIKFRAA
ncbi:MAG: hypothetical protein QW041_03195 [Candidatus Pacearchaeota archaeon]